MKYDKIAEVYTCENVPNGYGGFVKDIKLFGTFDVCITPIHCDVQIYNERPYTLQTCKLFTKNELPNIIDHVIVDGVSYNVLSHADFDKIQMLTLQKSG